MIPELVEAYGRLTAHEAFAHSHVSLDRDRQGGQALNIIPDWIENAGIAAVLDIARELELELVMDKGRLRLAPYGDEFSQRVQGVKRRLADAGAETDGDA